MPRIQIANVRSIETADIDISGPLVYLTGPNDGGKTSMARVIAGLVAGTGDVFEGKSKQIAQKVIALGQTGAAARLYDDKGSRTLRWSASKGTHKPEEQGDTSDLPKGSVYAAALASFLTMAPRDRNAAFWRVIPVKPTREQCDRHLSHAGARALGDAEWKELENTGFDATADAWGKAATRKAGEWAGIAGEAFGPEKALGWEAKIEPQTEAAPDIEALSAHVEKARADLSKAQKVIDERPPLPDNPAHQLTCPCCDKALMFRDGKLLPYEAMPADELKKLRVERAGQDGKLSKCRSALSQAERALIEGQIGQRDVVDDAKAKTEKARQCFKEWQALNAVAKMAGPKGVRMDCRDEVIDGLNARIADVATSMGIKDRVEIVFELVAGTRDEVVNVQVGGIPYDSLSGNLQWRARAILQIVIARDTGADIVVMDEAEALDPANRNRLFGALASLDMIAVIATYSASKDKAPDLAAAGLGQTYWCDDGTVKQLGEFLEGMHDRMKEAA